MNLFVYCYAGFFILKVGEYIMISYNDIIIIMVGRVGGVTD